MTTNVSCWYEILTTSIRLRPRPTIAFALPFFMLGSCAPEPKDDIATINGQTYVFPAKEEAVVGIDSDGNVTTVQVPRTLAGYPTIDYALIYDLRGYDYQSKNGLPWLFGTASRNRDEYMKDITPMDKTGMFYCEKKALLKNYGFKLTCGSRISYGNLSWTVAFGDRDLKFRNLIRKEAIQALADYRKNPHDKHQ